MTEVRNHAGQSMLRVEGGAILNHLGQTLATTEGGRLLNLQGQQLAVAVDGGFQTHGGAAFRLDGDTLLGPTGSELGTVTGGDETDRSLAAAAYVEFFMG